MTPETIARVALERWKRVEADPTVSQVLRIELRHKDGGTVPRRDPLRRAGGRPGPVRRRPRLRPRHQRAGAPRGASCATSEERYRSVIQSSPDLIWATNKAGRYEFVSDRVRDLLGWEPERGAGPAVPRVHRRAVGGADQRRLGARSPASRASPRPTGSTSATRTGRCGRSRCRPSRSSARARSRTCTASPATWPSASAWSASCARARSATGSSSRTRPTSSTRRTRTGSITYFSESVERVLGWVPQEVVGRHFRDIVRTPGGIPAGRRFAELAGGSAPTHDPHGAAGQGRQLPPVRGHGVRDAHRRRVLGRPRVRPRHPRARAPRARAARVRGALPLPRPVVARPRVDDRRRPAEFTFVSDQAQQILGWEPEELIGRSFADLTPDEGRRGALARFRWLQRRPTEAHRSRLNVRTRDGRELAMEITGIGMVARRPVPRGPRRGPRRLGARAAGARPPAPGRGARLVRGALAPRPRAPRLGDPGPVLDDAPVALDRAPAGQGPVEGAGEARLAARAAARRPGRDAGADLRAPPGQHRGVRPHPGAAHARRRRCPGGSGCRSSSRPSCRSGRRSRSRRRSTGSPRRRSTTSSSTPARARCGSRSGASRTASASRSPTTAAGSTRPRCPTAISGWPGCARAPSGSAAGSPSPRRPAAGRRSRSWCPRSSRPRPPAPARTTSTGPVVAAVRLV